MPDSVTKTSVLSVRVIYYQNLVQTSVTKALTDLGHVMETQDEPEEVDGDKISQAIANTWREPGNPIAGDRSTIPKGRHRRKSHEQLETQPR